MIKAPLSTCWTPRKVRSLFDASLRLVEAAAQVGFGKWTSLNLSSLRSQYKRHMVYRGARLVAAFPLGTLDPPEKQHEEDDGWITEIAEEKFWRPASPVTTSKPKRGKDKPDETLQKLLAAEARVKHLEKVENWESIFKGLPRMENVVGTRDSGTVERLRVAVHGRLKLMQAANKKREAEAKANRDKNYSEAKAMKDSLDREILPTLREHEDRVEAIWKEVAPAELVHSVSGLERDCVAYAHSAAEDRDYITARSLNEACSRLAEARALLHWRTREANIVEQMASRSVSVEMMDEQVKSLVASSSNLPALTDQPVDQRPIDLLHTASQLDLSIQKLVHKWSSETLAATRLPSQGENNSNSEKSDKKTETVEETNQRQRIHDINSLQGLAANIATALKRIRWREKICGLMAHLNKERQNNKDVDVKAILQADLHVLIEAIYHDGSKAQSIASRIITHTFSTASILSLPTDSAAALFRLMDDKQTLMEEVKREVQVIESNILRQRARWQAHQQQPTVLNGWLLRDIGSWGTDPSHFRDPCGVAMASDGSFWVSDRGNHRIQHLDFSGRCVRTMGFRGKSEGQLENPSGVALAPDGNTVFVADRGNDRVCVFNLDGVCVKMVGNGTGKDLGYMQAPCSVAVRKDGQLAVCDRGNNRVLIFDPNGQCVNTLGDNRLGHDVFRKGLVQPAAVCYDQHGRVVVADYGNHRIVVYGDDGSVCQEISGNHNAHDDDSEKFNGPSAVGVSSKGEIVVADQGHHRIIVFSPAGNFLRSFGFKGHELGRLHNPRGLAVGPHDVIAVADYNNHRIVLAEFCER